MRRSGLVAVAGATAVLATACGGAGHGRSAVLAADSSGNAGTTPSPSASAPGNGTPSGHQNPPGSPSTNGTSAPGGAATTRPGKGQPSPDPTYPQYVGGTVPAKATATVSAACLTRGGAQTLTVTTTGGFYISVDTQYSDGTDGRKHGGEDVGQVPPSGTYSLPFTVAPDAPLGKAIVFVALEGGHPTETAFRQPTFTVADHC